MPTIPLIAAESICLESPEIDGGSPAQHTPHTLTATANSTTTVTLPLAGTDGFDYIGALIEPVSGVEAGQKREVTAHDGAGVLTVDPAWDSAPGNVVYRLWRRPMTLLRAQTGGANSISADATADAGGSPARDEPAEFWSDNATAGTIMGDRYCAYRRVAVDADDGRVALITNDAAAGGAPSVKIFTVEASPITGAAGHLYYVVKRVRPVGGKVVIPSVEDATIERRFAKGTADNMEQDPRVLSPATAGVDLELELELQPVQIAATAVPAVARGPWEAGDLLDSIGAVDSDGAGTVSALSANGAVQSTVRVPGTGGPVQSDRYRLGNIVLINGQAAQVRGKLNDVVAGIDALELEPLLSQAPATGAAVTGGWNWNPITTGFRSHTYQVYVGGRRIEVMGWVPNLQIRGVVAESHGRLVFGGMADSHWQDGYRLGRDGTLTSSQGGDRWPIPQVEVPIIAGRSRVVIRDTDAAGNTWDDISDETIEFTLDVGYGFKRRRAVGTFGRHDGVHVGALRTTVGTLKVHADSLNWMARFQRATEFDLFIQLGAAVGGTFAVALPRVQFLGAPIADEDNSYVFDLPFQVDGTGLDITNATGEDTEAERRLPDVTLAWI